MRIPSPGDTELLVPLHEGLFEQPMWRTFLDRLGKEAGADCAALVIRGEGEGGVLVFGEGALGAFLSSETARLMREGRTYALGDLELAGLGTIAGLRAIRVSEPGGLEAWLAVGGTRDPGAPASALLSALAPHLRVALRAFAAIERERARTILSAEAMRRMNFGSISLDAKGRIVDCDAQAEEVLRSSGLLRRGAYDRLVPAAPQADRPLMALVRAFAADPDARPQAINLSHDPWVDILVAPLRVRPLAGGSAPVAAVYLRGDRSSLSDRHEQLVSLFNLTPSEARLAWSMAQGLSIKEAAAEHHLTVETARNYSKKIYAKTGARGQADLVRHILTGVLALA
ncbi:helix-turn-helix transcriptional regulator [Tsuneonella mangrovi]|uniref:helix-turn-helix transcriptional regulator n=1 Tax=Tsuneonella mangrovi TaxID=1982042 RepID=UPI000BA2A454|nr:chemotaxis protein CheY [Tsuneonella mangrovi]